MSRSTSDFDSAWGEKEGRQVPPYCEECGATIEGAPVRLSKKTIDAFAAVLMRKHRGLAVNHVLAGLTCGVSDAAQVARAKLLEFAFCSEDCRDAAEVQARLGPGLK